MNLLEIYHRKAERYKELLLSMRLSGTKAPISKPGPRYRYSYGSAGPVSFLQGGRRLPPSIQVEGQGEGPAEPEQLSRLQQ